MFHLGMTHKAHWPTFPALSPLLCLSEIDAWVSSWKLYLPVLGTPALRHSALYL